MEISELRHERDFVEEGFLGEGFVEEGFLGEDFVEEDFLGGDFGEEDFLGGLGFCSGSGSDLRYILSNRNLSSTSKITSPSKVLRSKP